MSLCFVLDLFRNFGIADVRKRRQERKAHELSWSPKHKSTLTMVRATKMRMATTILETMKKRRELAVTLKRRH